MPDATLEFESISSLSSRMLVGQLGRVAVTDALLERITRLDERLRSFIRAIGVSSLLYIPD